MAHKCGGGKGIFCDEICKFNVRLCDGHSDCLDGADESDILCGKTYHRPPEEMYTAPNADIVTTIVLPTILACILLVAAMLFGIKKCKQWEFDRIMEMRRTRRVVQRLTARLREKNFRTLQKARSLRKRAVMVQRQQALHDVQEQEEPPPPPPPAPTVTTVAARTNPGGPPAYYADFPFASGTSPPPPYEDAIFDEYFYDLLPRSSTSSSQGSRRSTQQRMTSFFGIG